VDEISLHGSSLGLCNTLLQTCDGLVRELAAAWEGRRRGGVWRSLATAGKGGVGSSLLHLAEAPAHPPLPAVSGQHVRGLTPSCCCLAAAWASADTLLQTCRGLVRGAGGGRGWVGLQGAHGSLRPQQGRVGVHPGPAVLQERQPTHPSLLYLACMFRRLAVVVCMAAACAPADTLLLTHDWPVRGAAGGGHGCCQPAAAAGCMTGTSHSREGWGR
jgi:hypothetical protein